MLITFRYFHQEQRKHFFNKIVLFVRAICERNKANAIAIAKPLFQGLNTSHNKYNSNNTPAGKITKQINFETF